MLILELVHGVYSCKCSTVTALSCAKQIRALLELHQNNEICDQHPSNLKYIHSHT